jgi:surface protein
MLLISPALPAETIVEVNTLQQAQDLGFREPVGAYSDGNLNASKTQGDAKGGDLALIMELGTESPRATIAYRVGGLSKREVSDLGSITLDYFVSESLPDSLNDLSLKLRCSNNTAITHSLENLRTEQWVEGHTITLATTPFYRMVDGSVVTKPLGPSDKPLEDTWVKDREWCRVDSIVDIQIGAGSNAGIDRDAQVFVDYVRMGTEADTHNFELPETTPEEESPEFHVFITNAIVSAEEVSTYLANSGTVGGFSGEAQGDGTYRVRAKFDWKRNQPDTDCPTTGDPFVQGLVSIEQFGLNSETGKVNQIADGERAFRCLKQLTGGDGFRDLDTSNLTTMKNMFSRAWRFDEWIGGFDTSGVTDFSYMFDDAKAFNQDISAWNTSKATTMYQMFYGALAFNGDIRTGEERTPEGGESYVPWTVSSVRDMGQMFYNANAFNQPIGNWDVSSVVPATACNENFSCNKGMSAMFASARIFNQDLSSWDVSAFGGQPVDNVNGLKFDDGARTWTGINPDTGVAWCNNGRPSWDGRPCPIRPPVVSQCEAGDQQISVVFNADPGATGNVTNITYSLDGGANYTTRSPASTDSPLVLADLTNGTSYSVLIKAIAGEDESAPSEANCTETPFGPASAPLNLVATAGDGLITVDFDPPADTNGDVITHYEYSVDGADFVSSGNDTPSITVTGADQRHDLLD